MTMIMRMHAHAQGFKELKLKNLGDYQDLYVQSDTFLLADVFENFRNKCTGIYKPDPVHFLSTPGFVCMARLKARDNIKKS